MGIFNVFSGESAADDDLLFELCESKKLGNIWKKVSNFKMNLSQVSPF